MLLRKFSYLFMTGVTALLLSSSVVLADDYIVNDGGDGSDLADDGVCEVTAATGDCTLRAAIEQANADDNDSVITFDAALNGTTITLSNGGFETISATVARSVTITGPGPDDLTIDGAGTTDRMFIIDDACNCLLAVNISGLTVTKSRGIAINDDDDTLTLDNMVISENFSSSPGGGVRLLNGSLTIINSTITNNTTTSSGGGISMDNSGDALTITDSIISENTSSLTGGGLYNDSGSAVTISGSTFSNNTSFSAGGAIRNNSDNSTIDIENSTISGNMAQSDGGGISNDDDDGTVVTLLNVTITNNTTVSGDGGGISNENGGGGTDDNTIIVSNSIIAGNTDIGGQADDCNAPSDDPVQSNGNNLIGDIVGCINHGFDDVTENDQIGDSSGAGAIDPMLAPLVANSPGTHAPLDGSPVFAASDNDIGTLPPALDQRGVDRTQGAGEVNDIGAVQAACGDGTVQATDLGEECDDGNNEDGDGCAADCTAEAGGDDAGDDAGDGEGDDAGDDAGDDGDDSGTTGTGTSSNGCSLVATATQSNAMTLFALFGVTGVLLGSRRRK